MMWVSIRQVPLWVFPCAFLLYFCGIVANAIRWYWLLRTQFSEISFGNVFRILLSGNYASNFLPSTVGGDTVRIVSTSRTTGWAVSMASVVVDRLINMLAMFVLLPLSWFVFKDADWLVWSAVPAATWRGENGALAISAISVDALWQRAKKWLWKARVAFGVWRDRRNVLAGAFLIALAARLSVFTGMLVVARGLGMSVNLLQVVGVGVMTYFFTLLPISLNGFGLREVTMTTLYVQLGASWEQASALVVLTRFILLIETLPGAVWISKTLVSIDEEDGFELELASE